MLTKFVVAFCVLALAAGFAGSVPTKTATYHVVLSEPATVNGTVALKAGEYRVTVAGDKVTFQIGKDSKEVAAKVETTEKKFEQNMVQYLELDKKIAVKEICFGGSKTKVVFN